MNQAEPEPGARVAAAWKRLADAQEMLELAATMEDRALYELVYSRAMLRAERYLGALKAFQETWEPSDTHR